MKKREKQVDKVQQKINIILCILPILAPAIFLMWNFSQQKLINQVTTAITERDTETALDLIENIDLLDKPDSKSMTILMTACKEGDGVVIKSILSKGANPNKHPNGMLTPLELFCSYGYTAGEDALYSLLKAGANPKVFEDTPPLFALANKFVWVEKEYKDVVTKEALILLQAGASLTYNDTSIVHYAAQYNFSELLDAIIRTQEGMPLLLMKDGNDDTPWNLAVKNSSVQAQRVIRALDEEAQQKKEELLEQEKSEHETSEETQESELTLEELLDILAMIEANAAIEETQP